jgi:uncharacterized protein (DUF2384 family)
MASSNVIAHSLGSMIGLLYPVDGFVQVVGLLLDASRIARGADGLVLCAVGAAHEKKKAKQQQATTYERRKAPERCESKPAKHQSVSSFV